MVTCSSFCYWPFPDKVEKRERTIAESAKDDSWQVVKHTHETSCFGTIRDIPAIYNISRRGPENETHTKIVDVPSPFKNAIRVDDELEPSRHILLQFEGIHESHYIGVNTIEFRDTDGNNIPYRNIQVDGADVDDDVVKPAFPVNGWWAVVGGEHSLLFDFDEVTHVKEIYFWCANSASTPKKMKISNSTSPVDPEDNQYSAEYFFQLSGDPDADPLQTEFEGNKSCEDVIKLLNETKPDDMFDSFMSSDGLTHFVFYEKGRRTLAFNYFFGKDPSTAIQLVNDTEVPDDDDNDGGYTEDVEMRAMTLKELQAVRAIIMSKCVDEEWRSSYDERRLRPEDVNLYDLNQIVILPYTKERNCAFKELFSSGDSKPTVYVSHWWGESVLDFIRCCEYHAVRYQLSPDQAKYWVCAYANRQHDLGKDLGVDPAQSSFNKAMTLAERVLLVCDTDLTVTSRIWVDFELYRAVTMGHLGLDIITHANGSPHLIAAENLPDETDYQKNKREQHFPFEILCKKMLEVELHKGDSSMLIDKVRILNTMIDHRPLDDGEVLERAKKRDLKDPKYKKDLDLYSAPDNAIRAELACKALSISLSSEGQGYRNFYGFNLLELIEKDALRKNILVNDIVGLDSITDDVLVTLVKLASAKSVERFEVNVKGCKNVTDVALQKMKFSSNLKQLSLNMGYSLNITNDSLVKFVSKIPSSLQTLYLECSGFKHPEGNYSPKRYGSLLEVTAKHIPKALSEFTFVATLDDEDGGLKGLLKLIRSVPSAKKLELCFESWEYYKSGMIVEIAKALPKTLENFSMKFYSGEYIFDDDLKRFAAEIAMLSHLKELTLYSRSNGDLGYYEVRDITSIDQLNSKVLLMD